MQTIEYLEQIYRLTVIINNKKAEIDELKDLFYGTSGIFISERVQSQNAADTTSEVAIKIIERENEITKGLADAITSRKHIINQIESMSNPVYCDILSKRFIQNKGWTEISRSVNYTYKQTKRLYRKALTTFENTYGDEYLRKDVLKCPKMS